MVYKVSVLGNRQTGKTSFINVVNGLNIADFELYDSPCDDPCELNTPLCNAYIVCYNVIDEPSFQMVEEWVANIRARHHGFVTILLVGTHADIDRPPRVRFETAENYASRKGLLFAETSTKMEATMSNACRILWQNLQPYHPAIRTTLTDLNRYIARIETKGDSFNNDLYLFASKRGRNREHEYEIAKRLKSGLMNNPPNIDGFFESYTVHSSELNAIIKQARKAFSVRSPSSTHPYF